MTILCDSNTVKINARIPRTEKIINKKYNSTFQNNNEHWKLMKGWGVHK